MKKVVLIAGGSGLIGKELAKSLDSEKYDIRILTRKPTNKTEFEWNFDTKQIDTKAFEQVNVIINLAGENVGGKLWTSEQKNKILQSRADSSALLHKGILESGVTPELYIGASASGYYGPQNSPKKQVESEPPGNDFLSKVCVEWENGHKSAGESCKRWVVFRIGVVFSNDGGAFPKMIQPIKFAMGATIGSGKQMIPWVHILDVVNALHWAIENRQAVGIYNLTAPQPISNQAFTQLAAKKLHRFVSPISVPEFALKTLMGEQASLVTSGNSPSSEKLSGEGFIFQYNSAAEALDALLK